METSVANESHYFFIIIYVSYDLFIVFSSLFLTVPLEMGASTT